MVDRQQSLEPGERASAQARAWVVRLASGGMSEAELDQLKAWRAASSEHERAFAYERAFWQRLQAVEPARPARVSRRTLFIGGGAAITAAAAGIAFAPDMRLLWQADYRTGPGEQLGVTLPDGSAAMLNTDSALAVDYRPDLRLVRLLRGEALFEVRDAPLPFRAAALGGATDMGAGSVALRAIGEEARVLLMRGHASVFAPVPEDGALPVAPRDLVELAPDQETHYRAGSAPSQAAPFDPDAELAWRSGRIIFDGKPFAAALAELGRYVPERVVLGGSARTGEPVSAVFSIRQANEAILALARTQGLSVRRIPGIVIYVA